MRRYMWILPALLPKQIGISADENLIGSSPFGLPRSDKRRKRLLGARAQNRKATRGVPPAYQQEKDEEVIFLVLFSLQALT